MMKTVRARSRTIVQITIFMVCLVLIKYGWYYQQTCNIIIEGQPPALPENKNDPPTTEHKMETTSEARSRESTDPGAETILVRPPNMVIPAPPRPPQTPIIADPFVPTRRIVHMDLKGAPPKVDYFRHFFRLISRLGATGVLIEWEDMFPYTGELADCRNGYAYTKEEVIAILGWAKENQLQVIPLVQTFGHLEWVLKHGKFAHLREVDRYAQTICLSNTEAIDLVKSIIDQVLSIHNEFGDVGGGGGGGSYFHMGADEAFQVGLCDRCKNAMKRASDNTTSKTVSNSKVLMLNHIKAIAGYAKDNYGRTVLAWHDMLDSVDEKTLNASDIGRFVEPVVWNYAEGAAEFIRPHVWHKLSRVFPYVWGASAYKGADGPARFYSNPYHYVRNHHTWTEAMNAYARKFQEFRGIILTGWQRFDHFAVLCELLPIGIPSLALNLQIVRRGGPLSNESLTETKQILGCQTALNVHGRISIAYGCKFPGYPVYYKIQELKLNKERVAGIFDDYMTKGWMSPFNLVHNYTSAWYLDKIASTVNFALATLRALSKTIRSELEKVFFEETVQEFLLEYVDADIKRLIDLRDAAVRLAQIHTFPRRPFPIEREKLQQQLQDTTTAKIEITFALP